MDIHRHIKDNPSNAFAALILFVLIGWISSGLLFGSIAAMIPEWKSILFDHQPQTAGFIRALVGINLPIMFLLPAMYVAGKYRPGQLRELTSINKLPSVKAILIAVLVLIISQPALNLIGEWNKHLMLPDALGGLMQWITNSEKEAETMSKLMLDTSEAGNLLLNILVVGIIPGVCEEFMFRGVVFPVFTDWFKRNHVAIWASAFIFSFIHFQFLGFVPRLLLGAMLGYFVYYSGSLWTSIIAHALNNSLIILIGYLQFNQQLGHKIDSLGYGETTWLGVLSIVLTGGIFYGFIKKGNS